MFRTRVIYLWLHMVAGFCGLLLGLAVAVGGSVVLLSREDEFKSLVMLVLLPFPLALVGCLVAIVGSFPMMALMQRLLIHVGNRSGRPAELCTFRRYLLWHSLVPALLPVLPSPLALLLPPARWLDGPTAALLLGAWAVATVAVWRWSARRLYTEWQAGVAY